MIDGENRITILIPYALQLMLLLLVFWYYGKLA